MTSFVPPQPQIAIAGHSVPSLHLLEPLGKSTFQRIELEDLRPPRPAANVPDMSQTRPYSRNLSPYVLYLPLQVMHPPQGILRRERSLPSEAEVATQLKASIGRCRPSTSLFCPSPFR